MSDAPVATPKETEAAQKFIATCDDLLRQYEVLEKEGHAIIKDLHTVIDKSKMKDVLNKILHHTS